ncbi:MAG: hypothetical protein ACT60Q_24020, partial [Ferrovibrionaceae bacterium]
MAIVLADKEELPAGVLLHLDPGRDPPTGWPEAMKHAFLTPQFALQTRHCASAYADPEFLILTCEDEAVGRLYFAYTSADLRVVDVSPLPERRVRAGGSPTSGCAGAGGRGWTNGESERGHAETGARSLSSFGYRRGLIGRPHLAYDMAPVQPASPRRVDSRR